MRFEFKDWLNEIAGDYSDFVTGWRGKQSQGPFADPQRKPYDPLRKRNAQFRHDPSSSPDDDMWFGVPDKPDPKPKGEYEGWTNWDTWAIALWAKNSATTTAVFRELSKGKHGPKKMAIFCHMPEKRKELIRFHTRDVDLKDVDWNELTLDFAVD